VKASSSNAFGGCGVDVATGADVPACGAVVGIGEFVVLVAVCGADEAALLVSRDGGVFPADGDREQIRATGAGGTPFGSPTPHGEWCELDGQVGVVPAFGARVRELRLERRMTQEGLAEAAELRATFVSNLERGYRVPSLPTVLRVAAGLGVSVSNLVDGIEA
jgi:DNA-binding XRE family transcriptional regulator